MSAQTQKVDLLERIRKESALFYAGSGYTPDVERIFEAKCEAIRLKNPMRLVDPVEILAGGAA